MAGDSRQDPQHLAVLACLVFAQCCRGMRRTGGATGSMYMTASTITQNPLPVRCFCPLLSSQEYVACALSDRECHRFSVNERLIRCLTVEPPPPDLKLQTLSEIAQVGGQTKSSITGCPNVMHGASKGCSGLTAANVQLKLCLQDHAMEWLHQRPTVCCR